MQVWRLALALASTALATQVETRTQVARSARFEHVEDRARSRSARSARHDFLRRFRGAAALRRSRRLAVIPAPKHMDLLGGADLVFRAGEAVRVSAPSLAELSLLEEHVLSLAQLRVDTDVGLPQIVLELEEGRPESYVLSVSSEERLVRIAGGSEHGVFNGLMTLRQLLNEGSPGEWRLPQLEIRDEPAFPWRGLMLDVSRHFFNASEVKHLLRTMAFFKLNRFHWHLSDDQGWRIPSVKYPKLTEVGAWRTGTQIGHSSRHDDQRYGGAYTAKEMKSIVAYAKSLHIEIIPEIDSPGHIQAALAAYPELGNARAAVATQFGALEHTMKPSERSMNFIQDVIGETSSLVSGGDFFHVGGDEVSTAQWAQSATARHFVAAHRLSSLQQIAGTMTKSAIRAVKQLGRRAVVWDDAMANGVPLPEDTVVMLWRSWLGMGRLARQAAEQGHAVVMCPQDRTYLDQFQSRNGAKDAFSAIGGFLDPKKVYELDLDGRGAKVLGGQGQLWSEYITGVRDLDYKAWPRGAALAEATWSGAKRPGYEDFARRWRRMTPKIAEVNFREADGREALRAAPAARPAPVALAALETEAVTTTAPHESWLKWMIEGPRLTQLRVQKLRQARAGLHSRVRRHVVH